MDLLKRWLEVTGLVVRRVEVDALRWLVMGKCTARWVDITE